MAKKGDPAKQPPECKSVFTPHPPEMSEKEKLIRGGTGTWSTCPNLQETGGGFEGERYECTVCGESYFLDYDDMR